MRMVCPRNRVIYDHIKTIPLSLYEPLYECWVYVCLCAHCHNIYIIHYDLKQKLTRRSNDVITAVFCSKKHMLTFRYFTKHLSRRRRCVLKLLRWSVSHHNLSAEAMNNDQSFSLIFAVGVSSYPCLGIYVFDECVCRCFDENCLCRSILWTAERSSVSIFLINSQSIFCLPVYVFWFPFLSLTFIR